MMCDAIHGARDDQVLQPIVCMEYLRQIGCDLAQGYYIARTMQGNAVLEWLGQQAYSNSKA